MLDQAWTVLRGWQPTGELHLAPANSRAIVRLLAALAPL